MGVGASCYYVDSTQHMKRYILQDILHRILPFVVSRDASTRTKERSFNLREVRFLILYQHARA